MAPLLVLETEKNKSSPGSFFSVIVQFGIILRSQYPPSILRLGARNMRTRMNELDGCS